MLEGDQVTQLTGTGVGIGTPEYMAPEQWTGQVVPGTDIYALGIVFFELVTGRKPFTADTPAAILLKQANDPLPRPKAFVPNLPEEAEKALFKALAKRPEDRYASMSEFGKALEILSVAEFRTGAEGTITAEALPETVLRSPVSEPQAAVPRLRRKPWWGQWWLWVGGVGMLVVAGVLLISGGGSPRLVAGPQPSATAVEEGLPTEEPVAEEEPVLETPAVEEPAADEPAIPEPTTTATIVVDAAAAQPEPDTVKTKVSEIDGTVLVFVPAGEFEMGSEDGEDHESPIHPVYLDAFWIDQTEVTNRQYAMCVAAGACKAPYGSTSFDRPSYYGNSQFDDYPVIRVDWYRAAAYCAWAGRRLPTEAEWEKAARGTEVGPLGYGRMYPWGEGIDCSLANYWGKDGGCVGDTTPVGSYPDGASPYGALDMTGNVWEWVADLYDNNYYSVSPYDNPPGPSSGDFHVMRGGSFILNWSLVRATSRFAEGPSRSEYDAEYGFRCATGAITP
jgi:serine/threonine-protein kinase